MNADARSFIIFTIEDKMMVPPRCSGTHALTLIFAVFGIACVTARPPNRIIGGSDAVPGEFPWQASIRSNDTHFCGGAIIGRRHILTAASCVVGIKKFRYADITVVTGSNTLEPGDGQAYRVKNFTIHELYVPRTNFTPVQNNIAVISLKNEIEENEYQKAIALPSKEVPSYVQGIVSGFGSIDRKGEISPILQKLNVLLLGKSHCYENGIYIQQYEMCAYKAIRPGICKGDSGSPLVYNGTVVGIVSISPVQCGIGIPDVYTRVYYYKDFIENAIANT